MLGTDRIGMFVQFRGIVVVSQETTQCSETHEADLLKDIFCAC